MKNLNKKNWMMALHRSFMAIIPLMIAFAAIFKQNELLTFLLSLYSFRLAYEVDSLRYDTNNKSNKL